MSVPEDEERGSREGLAVGGGGAHSQDYRGRTTFHHFTCSINFNILRFETLKRGQSKENDYLMKIQVHEVSL